MRTAIIGTGFVAGMHAQTLKNLGHTIVSVINPHIEKAQAFARLWGIASSSPDMQQTLLADIDAIHICTPPVSHYEIVKTALSAGLHVFCEKPLCLQPVQALELYHLAQAQQRIHAVNFNVRFHPVCALAREIVTSTEFGQPCLIHGSYLQEFHVLPEVYSWRYQPEQAGPMRAATEIGSHWIDLVRYWTGLEIEAVSANFGKFNPNRFLKDGVMFPEPQENSTALSIDSEDAAVISLRFNNSAVGSLLLSEVSHGRANQLSIEVTSRTQSVWWNSEAPYQLHQAHKSPGVHTRTFPFGGGFTGTFHDSIAAFYQEIENGASSPQPRYATFLDGAINAAVCSALYHSAMNHSIWTEIQPIETVN